MVCQVVLAPGWHEVMLPRLRSGHSHILRTSIYKDTPPNPIRYTSQVLRNAYISDPYEIATHAFDNPRGAIVAHFKGLVRSPCPYASGAETLWKGDRSKPLLMR